MPSDGEETVVVHTDRPATGTWSPIYGEHIAALGSHLQHGEDPISDEEFRSVREGARRILSHALPPHAQPSRRTGLVVGYVQSGKTMSMTAVSALAFDNGFRLIVALSGVTKNLHQQSADRFQRDLRGSEVGHQGWVILANPTLAANRQDLARLVHEWRSGLVAAEDQQALFLVVMKNHAHLAELARLLQTADLADIDALVIDDEADQAGLDTRPGSGSPSTTYRRIQAVRNALPRHTYLQYTATPQAPLLISLADMLSPEFAEVLEPGERYTGGWTFFVERRQLVRPIPTRDLDPAQAGPPESLLQALRLFFIGAAAHTIDRRGEKKRSMLVHPTRETPPQGHYTRWVERVIERWRDVLALAPGNQERDDLLDELRSAHQDIAATERALPRFDELVTKMPVAVTRIVVTQVNSATGHEVDWNRGAYHILVGGEKMSRGYTVRGLTVTYMPRPPGLFMADTIQQRARFFGYKQRYLGYCRVYLPAQLIELYSWYVRHEENVRDQLRAFRGPLREWRRAFFLQGPFRATRQNVLSDPVYRSRAPAAWFEQESPHFSPELIELNRRVIRSFSGTLTWATHEHDRHHVARGVPLHRVLRDMLVEMSFLGSHDVRESMAVMCRIADHLEDQAAATCTIIEMDAEPRPARRRTARNEDQAVDLQQGRDPRDRGYPGDASVYDADCVTIQIFRLDVQTTDEVLADVRAIAVHIPPSWPDDVVVQPGAP